MTRDQLIRLLAIALLMIVAGMPLVRAAAQDASQDARDQQMLDKALITGIRCHNALMVSDLLGRGADANARDFDARPNRRGTVQPPLTTDKPTALLIVFEDAQIPTGKRRHSQPQCKLRPDPVEIVKELLEKGANPNVIDYDQTFPLFLAVQYRYAASARLLLEHHADPNQTWLHGITPLHRAVSNKDVPTVKALLAAGANREARCAFDDPAHPLTEKVAELLKGHGHALHESARRKRE